MNYTIEPQCIRSIEKSAPEGALLYDPIYNFTFVPLSSIYLFYVTEKYFFPQHYDIYLSFCLFSAMIFA